MLLALTLLVSVAMSGCTSGSADTTEPSPTPAATATPTPDPSCCPEPEPAPEELKEVLGDIPSYSITVTGGNVSPVTLNYSDLKEMDFVQMSNASKMTMHGDAVQMTANYAGVAMSAILARAGVPDGINTIRVSAPDGYSMEYSMADLDHAIIGLMQNGAPSVTDIDNMSAIVLVMPGHRGPMWVKVPTQIEMIK